jgi:hypothetical protein
MNRLDRLDRAILSHCAKDHALLRELLASIPRGTLYRHVEKLVDAGLLAKEGQVYTTTEQGKCRLAELSGGADWNIWDRIYLPIRHVPTRQHRAMFELTTSAVVARKARLRDDHHAGFAYSGPPLSWKTTATTFQSHALGLDPTTTIIDLTTESGRSLLVRRDGRGNVLFFKRDILDRPLICFDDLLEVQPSLRPVLHHFLSGRIVIPVENTTISIVPVTVITLNPKQSATLEEQTSFSTAQLRRLVVLNLNQVRLPDLATIGHLAIEAAQKHGPLQLPAPKFDAQAYRQHIVALVRETLAQNVWARVDTEMLTTLVSGMSGFIADPERAIQQTLYDYAITAETLGWTTPGWSHAVSSFSLHTPLSRREQEPPSTPGERDRDHIIIWRSAMEGYRESALPPFVISDRNRARLLAIAIHENIPIECADHALEVILDNWEQQQRNGHSLDEAYSALQLSKDLHQRSLAIQDVKLAMRLRHDVHEGAYTGDDLQAALDLAPVLRAQGLTAHGDRLEAIVAVAGRLLNRDRSLVELEEWLQSQPDEGSQENEAPDSPGLEGK